MKRLLPCLPDHRAADAERKEPLDWIGLVLFSLRAVPRWFSFFR